MNSWNQVIAVGLMATRAVLGAPLLPASPSSALQSMSTLLPEVVAGTPVAIHKQGDPVTNDDGTANLQSLQRHILLVRSKYQSTIAAYLANTGSVLGETLPPTPEAPGNVPTSNAPTTSEASQPSDSWMQNSSTRKQKRQAESLQDYQNDLLWAGNVGVGTPPQDFLIMFDTGSSDFFVPSVQCVSSACQGHSQYDQSLSTTSKRQRGSFAISYGDGSSTGGPVYTDTITVGTMSASKEFLSPVTQESDSFASDPEDGIFGMAYPSISNMNGRKGSAISARQFGFRLAKTTMGTSELFLGGANPAHYTGRVEWHAVQKHAYYNISGIPLLAGISAVGPRNTIIDTGTTVIVAPPGDADTFWNQVPGAKRLTGADGYYSYPCANPPAVSFAFPPVSGTAKVWKVSSQDMNLGLVSAGSTSCVGAITGVDVGLGDASWILGDAFLKNVYSVFDMTTNQVGFAAPV